jgi:hypothetical protein
VTNVRQLSDEDQTAMIEWIVQEFGDGAYNPNGYVFDQITHRPSTFEYQRLPLTKAIDWMPQSDAILLLDRHPNNRRFAECVMHNLGLPNTWGMIVPKTRLEAELSEPYCDAYITTADRSLLIVACHEDDMVDGERIVWVASRRSDRIKGEPNPSEAT